MRVNGTVHKDALRAGVTPNSEHTRLLMKSRGQEYGSNMRLGEYRPPANQSSEHKRSPAATPTSDHRITPQSVEGAMTHTTSSYSGNKSSPRQNSNRAGSRNSEKRQTDQTTSAFTPVQRHPKDSRRNELSRASNTPGGHGGRRHNTSPENRYDLLTRQRREVVPSGALTTDNLNRHVRKEYFKGDFPVRRSNSNSTLNDTLDRIGSNTHLDGPVHRGYGSTSSIDMQSVGGESFFQMVQKFRADVDQRSPAPPQLEKLLGGGHVTFAEEIVTHTAKSSKITMATAELKPVTEATASPKLTRKGTTKKDKDRDKEKEKTKVSKTKSQSTEKSIFSKLLGKGEGDIGNTDSDLQSRVEERYRQKAFAHYDCQSITVNLNEVIRNRQHGWKRKNTTTGASAASRGSNSNTPQGSREDLSDEDSDFGDGKSNDLVMSCPFFRNEIGGETERKVSLSRASADERRYGRRGSYEAILEGPKVRLSGGSPGSPDNPAYLTQPQIERIDYGAHYYRDHFFGQEHQNYLGIDENLGPVAVSIKREKLEDKDVINSSTNTSNKDNNNVQYQYRIIIRTSELTTLRGSILEEAIPSAAKHGTSRGLPLRDVLEYVAPELQLSCLRLAVSADKVQEQLMKLDEQGINNKYKVGVMYCKAGQSTEEEMYNNEHAGPAFEEFLNCLGETVKLQGFDKYRAQLDNKTDSTGTHSLYTTYQNNEIMFHVSTMLPYTPNNKQQLLRKRHIGNDIVTIVFQEEGAAPFTPKTIRSHFQHVFILVQAHHPNTDSLHYSVAVSRSKDVPTFGPPLPEPPTFQKSKLFTDFILAKIINAENAVHRSEKFVTMAVRTRQEYLRDLANNSVSNATIDTSAKFGKFTLWDKKKEKSPPKVFPENITKGAIVWRVQVEDSSHGERLDCSLGISAESVVLIGDEEQDPIFSVNSKSVIGWTPNQNSLKLFYNEGECIVMYFADNDEDEIQAVVNRLDLVSDGCETKEITLRRNGLGQLGFHVHYQGLVAEVEQYGFAWQAGLRKGSRLVEICKVAVCTLTHDQMIDLLRTSMTVKVVIILPHEDGTPRRGVPLLELTGTISNYTHLDSIHRSHNSKIGKSQQLGAYISDRDHSPHNRASSSPASMLTGSKLTPPRSERKHRPPPDYSPAKRDNHPPPYNEVRAAVAKLEQRFTAEDDEKKREEKSRQDSGYRGKHRQTSSERPHRSHRDEGQSSAHNTGKTSREIDIQFARESLDRQSGRISKNQRHIQNMQAYANRQGDPQFVNRAAYHDAKQTNAMSRLPLSCSAASAFTEAERSTPLARHATSMSISSGDTSLTSTSTGTSNSTGASDEKWYDTGDEFHDNSFSHEDIPRESSTDTAYDNVSQDTYDTIRSSYDNQDAEERPPKERHPGTYASVDNLLQSSPNVAPTYLHKTYPPRDRDAEPKQPLPIYSEHSAFDRPLTSLTNLSESSSHSGSSNISRQGYHSQVHSLTRSPQIARRKLLAASPEMRDVKKKAPSVRDTDSPLSGRVSSSESLTSRLRPGATPRSAHKQSRPQTSTVKEDLLKLITPDITELEVQPASQPKRTGTVSPSHQAYTRVTLQRTLSDESLSGGGTTRKLRRGPALDLTDSLVFTSTQKSTYPSRMIAETTNISGKGKESKLDKTVVSGNTGSSLFPLPDQGSSLEWSNLVETAKSFEGLDLQSVKSASMGTLDEIADTMHEFELSSSPEQYNGPSREIRSGGEEREAEFSEGDLKMQLLHLTRQLSKERHQRQALEAEVGQLREDNVRLQEESQTAAAQLRKFTEWFFNTIDRQ
ncbi:signal-induced proliferation-associated 1-like protein 1 [Ptychodera flava]|uniref:signal-induced proliferation-associated 1-like protein 1 n=1 Tax=Ptychodera flava TaxID=63121 RepID=UPI003969D350